MAGPDEPGTPLVVSGTLRAPGGSAPVPGAAVFVYHTDAAGLYTRDSNPGRARLHGHMRTDARGRFEFRTIQPGRDPGGGNPAHVHFVVTLADGSERYFELLFEGDPDVSESMRRDAARGRLFVIRPIGRDADGVGRVQCDLQLRAE
jgi:protocatechuate 3,4-dioxygenase beta subunit